MTEVAFDVNNLHDKGHVSYYSAPFVKAGSAGQLITIIALQY